MKITVPLSLALILMAAACGEAPPEADASVPFVEPFHVSSENADRLIPREVLFGNPEHVGPQLSPDGSQIAYIAPADHVLNLWVMNRDMSEPRQLTYDTNRGVTDYFWAENGEHILYMQDEAGEENTHVYRLTVETGEVLDLTPFDGVKAHVSATDENQPNTVLIETNQRNSMFFDVYRCDLVTGELEMAAQNPGVDDHGNMVLGYMPDEDLNIRLYYSINPDNGFITIYHRWTEADPWEETRSFSSDEEWGPRRFTNDGRGMYISSNLDSDLSALYFMDIETGEERLLAFDSRADLGGVSFDPYTGDPRLVSFTYLRTRRLVLCDSIAADVAVIETHGEGDWAIASRDNDDRTWIVVYYTVDNPAVYHILDRDTGTMTHIWSAMPALEDYRLAEVEPVEITSRDGLTLPSYLTLPDPELYGDGPWPLIMYVHGGPWYRDFYGYDPFSQLFADRGFAVLQVNFRGSTGFGKQFVMAGNKQWGSEMQNDITDGVLWAVENEIADPERVVILGGSYGGYAALAGAAFTPELYCAVVDFFGPSNLITFMETVPPYWRPLRAMMDIRVGNPDDETDRAMLEGMSPLNYPENITMPIFIVQGENDPRVVKAESDQMVDALRAIGTDVLYVVYGDEGHGFAREENRLDFAGRVEEFLYLNVPGVECQLFQPVEGATVRIE